MKTYRCFSPSRIACLLVALPAAVGFCAPASAAVTYDQIREPHTAPMTCATCRYVTIKRDGEQQFRLTHVGTAAPAQIKSADEFVFLLDGSGGVSQYLPAANIKRAKTKDIQWALASSGTVTCNFSSATQAVMPVEYYAQGHKSLAIDDKGISLTQQLPMAIGKSGTFYVFRGENSVACGAQGDPKVAAWLVDSTVAQKPAFKDFVEEQVTAGLKKYLDLPAIPQPEMPASPLLKQDEYESSADFNRRVESERVKRNNEIVRRQQEFVSRVEKRNQLITERLASRDAYADQLTRQATLAALGRVMLENAKYDADTGVMHADLVSRKTDFSRRVAFRVPNGNNEARNLKSGINDAELRVRLDVSRSGIALRDMSVALDGRAYAGTAVGNDVGDRVAQTIDLRYLDGQAPGYVSPAQMQQPELVDRLSIRVDDGAANDDVRSLVNDMAVAAPDPSKWLFAIAVENYVNVDRVTYAKNSGELIVAAFQKKFGISPRNTYALIDTAATAGAFKDDLATLMQNVRPGDTVYFYYSGHGIPDPKSDEAYILPRDKKVEFVATEDYLRLSKIYQQLAASKASKIYAFVDSCFSGKTDNISNFEGIAPGVLREHKLTVDKEKMVVFTAGKYNQFSNVYQEKGHRMFSYFLLKSLVKMRPASEPVRAQEMYQEIAVGVRDASFAKGDVYLQEPQLLGNMDAQF